MAAEVVMVTPDGDLPFKPVSREAYLLGRQKAAKDEIDKLGRSQSLILLNDTKTE